MACEHEKCSSTLESLDEPALKKHHIKGDRILETNKLHNKESFNTLIATRLGCLAISDCL